MLTLAELLLPETTADIADRIRSRLLDRGFPTGSWAPSPIGLENLRIEAVAGAVQALIAKRVAAIANGRLLATARDVPLVDGGDGPWLSYLGQEVYRLERRAASKTIKYIALYSTVGASQPAFDLEPGDLVVRAPSTGNRYRSIDGGHFDGNNVLPPNSASAGLALVLRFEAEAAGAAYADPVSTITEMVTSKAGMQCTNRRPTEFLDTLTLGASGGAVGASFTTPNATLPTFTSVLVRIDSEGDVGTGTWSWRIPGGAWTFGGPIAPTAPIPGAATITFADGQTSPSFFKGDLFVLYVGSDVYRQGADQESEAAFARACRFRHQQISDVPVGGAIELLARAVSLDIAGVSVDADVDTPAIAVMTMASSVGPASPTAMRAASAFVTARFKGYQGVGSSAISGSPAERAVAISALTYEIAATGTVFCPSALMAAAKTTASAAWLSYLGSIAVGGSHDPVKLARLIQIVLDAGAEDMDDEALNGTAADVVVPAGSVPVVPAGQSLATSLTWVPT